MENEHPNIPVPVRNYTKNYPALAPLASGENDNPAAEINVGTEIRDEHIVAASRQHSAREHLCGFHLANQQEVMASKKRLAGLINESVSTLPLGQDWGEALIQTMNAGFLIIIDRMNAMDGRMNAGFVAVDGRMNAGFVAVDGRMNAGFVAVDGRLNAMNDRVNAALLIIIDHMNAMNLRLIEQSIQTAKLANRTLLLTATDSIVPVPSRAGRLPNAVEGLVFPVTLADITSMDIVHVDALLDFYGIPRVGNLPDKKAALCSHLGLEQLARAFQNN